MSGGVDSSVAAALCVEAGHRVIGIMLRLWAEPSALWGANRCCAPDAVDDAKAVATALGIPFSVIDAESVFKRDVVDRFVADSAAGDTPNPCLLCNRKVRFGFLLEQARALGADALATGHYAQVGDLLDGRRRLLRGIDRGKDQSYVLCRLDQAQLAHVLFPVGAMVKADVRRTAERFGLPVAGRADSMDLCWAGDGGIAGFLSRHLPEDQAKPGPIVDRDGRTVGEHRGLPYYTLGQRRGLGVSLGHPVHVVARDTGRNALVVGPAEALYTSSVAVRDMHWISGYAPGGPERVQAQIRYRAPAAAATISPGPDRTAEAQFDTPQRAPTPGQALVVYDGDVCLGGGLIAGRAAA
jgi:tRNA-specific 2-thiouridylase